MDIPLISVIIPAYNAERWIAEAVRSVQAQTEQSWELILVNDGSTDDTSTIARGIDDPRIKVIDKSNAGVSAARNTGLDNASGTYIAFLDADDAMLSPDSLRVKMNAIRAAKVDWVYSDIWQCDAEMRPVLRETGTDGDVVRKILSGRGIGIPGISSNIMAHRNCFDAGIRFDVNLSNSADQDIALSLASAHTYTRVPEALNGYRVLSGSMSRNIALYQKDHLYLFAKAERNGLLKDRDFLRYAYANAYWAIGGSWWKKAGKPAKAIPWFVKALIRRPTLLLRPFLRTD
ncbi:MAG: glycosyltransferase [Flavobacteriales bacterium]|nr:glycosyltransferase [Flavobacteriales bacterium]HQW39555.1 glycosyltransferase [Flavobacteriales bacterium]